MKSETADWDHVAAGLEALRQEMARLGERVAALETAARVQIRPAAPAAHPAPAAAQAGDLSEEIVLVISAAIAAFLGKRAPIRQIRLLGSAAWAEQGRVMVQASHALALSHG